MSIKVHVRNALLLGFMAIVVGTGMVYPQETGEKIRRYTREVEFDYLDWTVNALWLKATQGRNQEMGAGQQKELVYAYLNLVAEIQSLDSQIAILYADPSITDPLTSSRELAVELKEKQTQLQAMTPTVEGILQEQVGAVLKAEDLEILSGIFPPVLYHTSDMPLSLLVSPRDRIQLDANISIQPGLTDPQKVDMENDVESGMNVSALIEEVGGLGTYPAMIMLTTDLNWLVETIAHEWVHNYLTLYPLGLNYETSSELRTMNETVANLAGKEIGARVIELYYPERVPPPVAPTPPGLVTETLPPAFDFREEMRITREHVDVLLSRGEIKEAEIYMELRRRVFWDNGYLIRRINQAYFAFHGGYNDIPGGGASGADPVGPAVVLLREKSSSLRAFLKTISKMSTYEQLKEAIDNSPD